MLKQNFYLSIGDMQCAECESNIEEAVSVLPGVMKAKASFEDESLTLELNADVISLRTVCAAIKAAGYYCKNAKAKKRSVIPGVLCRFCWRRRESYCCCNWTDSSA